MRTLHLDAITCERMANRSLGSKEYTKSIPRNPKYDHVKTKLDTDFNYRNDEIFKRLKLTTFAQMILQVTSAADLNENETDSESHDPGDRQDARAEDVCRAERSTLHSLINGVGELNLNRKHQEMETMLVSSPQLGERPYPDCPYLLLDARDRDQYDCCHIIGAHSWPVAMVTRRMHPFTKDMLKYKNAAGKMVIVYDVDETVAIQAANIMCERGFENLFLLSGGLKVIAQMFPEGLTTGSIPTSCMTSPKKLKVKKSSRPPQPPPQAAEERWRFTSDEVAQIQRQLEEILANRRRSSRGSTSKSRPQAPNARSRSLAARKDGGRLPFTSLFKYE